MDTYKFFWIASGEYIPEAVRSAKSLRKHHPDAELTLFTDDMPNGTDDIWSSVVHVDKSKAKYWFLKSTEYMNKALWHYDIGDRVVYLDTDTHVCAPLDGIFQMLSRFDFVGTQAPGRRTAPTSKPITDAFPEYNIGVNGFAISDRLRKFVQDWLLQYMAYQDTYRNNDQAPLRETIWNYRGSLEFGTLPIEYNFRFGMGGQVREPVRVLHGRCDDYESLEKLVNPGSRIIRAWKNGELR